VVNDIADLPEHTSERDRTFLYAFLFDDIAKVGVSGNPRDRSRQHVRRYGGARGQSFLCGVVREVTLSEGAFMEKLVSGMFRHGRSPGHEWFETAFFPMAAVLVSRGESLAAPFSEVALEARSVAERVNVYRHIARQAA